MDNIETLAADIRFGGVGRHEEYLLQVDPAAVKFFGKILLPIAIFYLISVILPRLAILNMYRSIFTNQKAVQIVIHIVTTLIIANCIGSLIAGLFSCIPLEYLWDKSLNGHCFNINAWYRYVRLINVLTDVVILVLPLPHVMRLQGSIQVKIGLFVTFLMGSLYVERGFTFTFIFICIYVSL